MLAFISMYLSSMECNDLHWVEVQIWLLLRFDFWVKVHKEHTGRWSLMPATANTNSYNLSRMTYNVQQKFSMINFANVGSSCHPNLQMIRSWVIWPEFIFWVDALSLQKKTSGTRNTAPKPAEIEDEKRFFCGKYGPGYKTLQGCLQMLWSQGKPCSASPAINAAIHWRYVCIFQEA